MKKSVLLIVSLLLAVTMNAQDVVSADFTGMDQLIEKLNKALEKTPKECGTPAIDSYITSCSTAAVGAVASAKQLHELYTREVSTGENGEINVTENKPTLEDWTNLAAAIAVQAKGVADIANQASGAAQALKSINPLKAAKIAKSLKWSGDILPVVTKALAEQGKAVGEIIKTLKTRNNL